MSELSCGMPAQALRAGDLLRNQGDGELWRVVAVTKRSVTVEYPDGHRASPTLRQET